LKYASGQSDKQTDRYTDMLITKLRTPPEGKNNEEKLPTGVILS